MKVLIPGTFSIFHKGHAAIALHLIDFKMEPVFGVTANSYDKPEYDIGDRISNIRQYGFNTTVLTGKSILQHCKQTGIYNIAVDHDLFERIVDPKYYLNSKDLMIHCLKQLDKVILFVFPRNGKLRVESDILPKYILYMEKFEEVF
jgi:phosphopantetheine adenylyltransferase